ncbi:EAL domain-containing protein [Mycolicibacterium vaccae]|uniref:PAS/PAC and GAF sensor-containing diguanylate cyclase/phosphodiesterase n=1 Tax=Mycolicibacterium vaccae ATCC 25954 TaxID=1194972 RepID=K0V3Z7_MYCVA|nr:EAL domain-containing protein [Mycolicibacterium vaccae]ANI38148.1 diguanylate phosphodiesterase [Mycolicibacterium vaccae 95051]EJZ12165.1 PAS/PAC and GAF sensor-containing diguanylate cyclase/phosphodiesterase [Mycolicibacterium vaccae ATCC 25954]MCV7060959.1 EAL domain-containing protein [Mycolicibacterium vaccae]
MWVEQVPGYRSGDEREVPVDLVRTLLGVLRHRLGLDAAWLSVFQDGMQVIEVLDGNAADLGVSPGQRYQMSESYCVRVIDGRLPAVIPDTSADQITAALPITRDSGLGAYVGVPVLGEAGATVGMVCVVSREAKPDLAEEDLRIVKQVADLIGTLIDSPPGSADPTVEQRKAIRRVVSERDFEVVFQSIHDASSGKVVGVEALARFPCEPFRPDKFFEQAALQGLGIELETAIVGRVLTLIPQLPEDAFVAMNISPAAALAVPWHELLADVDPSRIVLEITEHDAIPNYGALDDALDTCRARGMRVAIDDVGAGFASFSHVLELAPEFVKIDQSITRHIDVDDARRRLAQAIAQFAGQIGATVIAEGVETQGELDAVVASGISWAQGYCLSRPKPHHHGFPAAQATAAPAESAPTAVDLLGERPFELALAHSPIGMAVVGLDGKFLRTNRALRTMLGYSRRALAELTFQEITHPDDLDSDLSLVAECLARRRRSYRIDKRYIAADGHVVWCALTAVLVHAPRDRPLCFVSQIVDVTAERVRAADLARQAATDPLTAIANRSAGWSRLEELDANDDGYGVLFCDIERFKAVNDSRGHHAGDQLLVEVATRLLATVGDEHLVVRWGGDEFLVITDIVEDRALGLLAAQIAGQFEAAPIALTGGTTVPVTLTIGVATHRPGDGRSVDAVLDRADQAMYDQRRRRHIAHWYARADAIGMAE